MTRRCPRCEVELVARENGGVEVDLCAECGGVFLDESEFDRLIAERFEDKPLESLFAFLAEEAADSIDCPGCQHAMHQLDYDGIELDRCPECGGIFIDGYERREFARRATEAEVEANYEEMLTCDGCGNRVPKRLCIRRMDAYWCEACVVAGNHPGPEAQLVGVHEMKTAAAVALARGQIRQQETRERARQRREMRSRMGRRFRPHGAELGMLEIFARWVDGLFNRR